MNSPCCSCSLIKLDILSKSAIQRQQVECITDLTLNDIDMILNWYLEETTNVLIVVLLRIREFFLIDNC